MNKRDIRFATIAVIVVVIYFTVIYFTIEWRILAGLAGLG